MNSHFILHPRLAEDCITLGRFGLCRPLLMNASRSPWFILVPEKQNLTEIFHLNKEERMILMEESSYLAESLTRLYRADKMNIAA